MNNFGLFIRTAREAKGLSISAVAEQAGINHSHLSRVESGDRNPPKIPTLVKLAQVLDIPVSEMMEKAGYLSGLDGKEKAELENAVNSASGFLDDAIKQLFCLIGDAVIDRKPLSDKIDKELVNGISVIARRYGDIDLRINALDPRRFIKVADSICRHETEFKIELLDMLKSLAKKYHLWEDPLHNTSPDPYMNEEELLTKVDLELDSLSQEKESDDIESIINNLSNHTLEYKGHITTEEQKKHFIQLLQNAAAMMKQ